MAALTIAAGWLGACAGPSSMGAEPASIKQKVTLNVRLTGPIGQKAEVTVKPGHAACRFKPITRAIDPDVVVPFGPFDVESFSAEGDCSFAITIKEPGQPDKTVRRSLQLAPKAAGKDDDGPTMMTCYISSRSLSPFKGTPPAVAAEPSEAKRKK